MNKVILMGRLTKDPDVRYTTDGKAIAKFTLAVDRRMSGENTADFISCVSFGKTAEFLEKYVNKGTKIVIDGRIQTGNYTNKDGQKVYTTDVVCESVEFAESKVQSDNKPQQNADDYGFMSVPEGSDEDLPFGRMG